ncbi:peptide ABC transporter permease [Microbacterium mangrovi]|uniref:Peptide ABC transporter permease n=1 Tax=Microbacterium mangrovi TaxID=1348253 RepID=A0A0B2A0U6_9MICO|nr:ABC transporter permease [Microbacterium mangrovi]KHK95161.1 peptide ABC transporter permease [Microbacterium mangrovi]
MTTQTTPVQAPRKRSLLSRIPVISQLRQSVGLQRFMLVLGLVLTVTFILVAAFAAWIAPYGWAQQSVNGHAFGTTMPPNSLNLWGTTVSGFDVLSRTVWGAQTALLAIICSIAFSIVIGVILGLIGGYFGGWFDRTLVMLSDAIYAFPSLLLAIVMSIMISGGQSDLRSGILAAAISITVVFVPQYFRVIRSEVVRVKAEPFVESARVIGVPTARILVRHVLRNSTRSLPVVVTLNASEALLTLAGLGFLGFGIEPTAAAEWGYDLNRSVADVSAGIWWTAIPPGIAIVLVVLGITLVGESLNDLSDPRLRTRRRAGGAS